jgi:hypothetical protein
MFLQGTIQPKPLPKTLQTPQHMAIFNPLIFSAEGGFITARRAQLPFIIYRL